MPESNRVKTRVIIPADTVFDFAGDGLTGSRGQLAIDAGAGFTFNENGRLIFALLEMGGLGFFDDRLCLNFCEVAQRLAGEGLRVSGHGHRCKLAVDFQGMADCGLKMTEEGKFAVDTAALAGTGLVAGPCDLHLDVGFLAGAVQSQIDNDAAVDPSKTITLPYVVSTEYRYKPNGYGYNSGLEIIQTTSTLVIHKNAAGRVVTVDQGPVNTTTQDFDFGGGVPVNVAERAETPVAPNFYSKD